MDQVVGSCRIAGDFDKFRLRRFVKRFIDMDAVEIHDEPVALAEMSGFVDATSKALLFRKIGPEQHEVLPLSVGRRTGSPRPSASAKPRCVMNICGNSPIHKTPSLFHRRTRRCTRSSSAATMSISRSSLPHPA
jgi:hypothetical protein